MTSQVINMVDRMKDDEDLALEAMFAAEPIADDGFSDRVLARIRRRLWLRRLALPVAATAGIALAFRPALDTLTARRGLIPQLPADRVAAGGLSDFAAGLVPQAPAFAVIAIVTLALLLLLPALED